MRYYSKRFTVYLLPRSLDSISILHSRCTFSTPRGAFWPGATSGAHTCHIKRQITFALYWVPIYTPGWRVAMWIKGLAELRTKKCPAFSRESNPQPFDADSRVQSNIPRHLHQPYMLYVTKYRSAIQRIASIECCHFV